MIWPIVLFIIMVVAGVMLVDRCDAGILKRIGLTLIGLGLFGFVAELLVAAVLLAISPAAAHDHDHPELDGWMMGLHNGHDVPCCDGSDAVHLADPDWDSKGGHYRVRLEGEWVEVPDEAVIKGPNRDGRTLVWPYYVGGKRIGVRCFMPGSMT